MKARDAGFTLLEVVIALGILTLGISSALGLYTAATAAHKRAIDRTHVSAIVEHAFAAIESALASGVDPMELAESVALVEGPVDREHPYYALQRNFPGYRLQTKLFLVPGPGEDDQLLVRISVAWKQRGQERSDRFEQLVARETFLEAR